jgi:hypothetical protein
MMMARFTSIVLASAAVVAGALFYPTRVTVAPEWNVKVIDNYGRPVIGANIREVWEEYSVENESHEEDKVTGTDGTLYFPLRTMRSSVARRITGCLANIFAEGVHTSCGAQAYLVGTNGAVNFLKTTGDSWSGRPKRVTATISF